MMLKALTPVLAFLTLPALAAHAGEQPDKWAAWIDGGAFYSNKDESRGETTLWAPLVQSPTAVFFFEAEGKLFEESQKEGNFALAYRQMLSSGWNLGAWGGYDIRSTSLGSRFNQLAGGIEALSTNWDFRLNGYLPLNDSELISESSQQVGNGAPMLLLNGSSILMQTGLLSSTSRVSELAFGGFDSEVGLRLPVEDISLDPQSIDLRLYGGGFYFDNSDADKVIAGPRVRAELRLNDVVGAGSRLTFEASYSYDDVRGDIYESGARLRIPLGEQRALASMRIQDQRMSEQLHRDTDIVASTKTTSTSINTLSTEAVQDAATNIDLDKVAYVDGSTAGGITGVANAEGANTLIIANGSFNANSVLQSAQTLLGGGGAITLKGKTTGTQAAFIAPGAAATITGQSGGYTVIAGSDTHIAGLNIDATAAIGGIRVGTNAPNTLTQNVVIDHNTITGGGSSGVTTSSGSVGGSSARVLIADNVMTNVSDGVNAFNTTDLTIRDNVISGATHSGINAQIALQNLTITGNEITTVGNVWGIGLGGSATDPLTVTIESNIIHSVAGIIVFGSNGSGTIAGNTFDTQTGGNAISLLAPGGVGNTYQGAGNVLLNGSACYDSVPNANPGMAVFFTNTSDCPH